MLVHISCLRANKTRTIHSHALSTGTFEMLSATLWFKGCFCRWNIIWPLWVILESACRLLSDIVLGAVGRGLTLPPPHENFGKMWPLQRHHVLWLVTTSENNAVDSNPSPYLATYSVLFMKLWLLSGLLHPLSWIWGLCFCVRCFPLGTLDFLWCLHCWRSANASPDQEILFAWQTLIASPRACSPSRLWLGVLLLVSIALCSLDKDKLALLVHDNQLLCLMHVNKFFYNFTASSYSQLL